MPKIVKREKNYLLRLKKRMQNFLFMYALADYPKIPLIRYSIMPDIKTKAPSANNYDSIINRLF